MVMAIAMRMVVVVVMMVGDCDDDGGGDGGGDDDGDDGGTGLHAFANGFARGREHQHGEIMQFFHSGLVLSDFRQPLRHAVTEGKRNLLFRIIDWHQDDLRCAFFVQCRLFRLTEIMLSMQ